MTLAEWIDRASTLLQKAGVETSRLEAQLLAAHELGRERAWVLAHADAEIPPGGLEALLARRLRREPLAYILGYREFYGRRFKVDPRVLVPRQETETMVEAALDLLAADDALKVLDLGTGSGCIGITLALERPNWRITLSDVSETALTVARENAELLGAKVQTVQSDRFEGLKARRFDAIVTNPPYIEARAELQPEVRDWEPRQALFAGEDGLDFYVKLAEEVGERLEETGLLLTEVGDAQADPVARLFFESEWEILSRKKDLIGIERVLGFRKRG